MSNRRGFKLAVIASQDLSVSEHLAVVSGLLTVGSLRESYPGKNKSVPAVCLVPDFHSQQAGCAETTPAAGGSGD